MEVTLDFAAHAVLAGLQLGITSADYCCTSFQILDSSPSKTVNGEPLDIAVHAGNEDGNNPKN